MTEYWVEFPVLYSRTLLCIYSIYNSLHLLIPNSQSRSEERRVGKECCDCLIASARLWERVCGMESGSHCSVWDLLLTWPESSTAIDALGCPFALPGLSELIHQALPAHTENNTTAWRAVPEPGQDLSPAQFVIGIWCCLRFPTILPQPQRWFQNVGRVFV